MASPHHLRRAPSLAVAAAALALAAPSAGQAAPRRAAGLTVYVQPREFAPVGEGQTAARWGSTDRTVSVEPRELAPVEEQTAARSGLTDAVPRLSEQEGQVLASRGVGAPAPSTHITAPRAQSTDGGLDWSSAGVGAAAAAGLLLIAVGGLGAANRARIRLAR